MLEFSLNLRGSRMSNRCRFHSSLYEEQRKNHGKIIFNALKKLKKRRTKEIKGTGSKKYDLNFKTESTFRIPLWNRKYWED